MKLVCTGMRLAFWSLVTSLDRKYGGQHRSLKTTFALFHSFLSNRLFCLRLILTEIIALLACIVLEAKQRKASHKARRRNIGNAWSSSNPHKINVVTSVTAETLTACEYFIRNEFFGSFASSQHQSWRCGLQLRPTSLWLDQSFK